MSQGFGRNKSPYHRFHHTSKKWSSSGIFLALLIICLCLFSVHYRLTSLLFDEKKIDIVQHKLGDIANYISFYDPISSRILARIDQIIQSSQQEHNILVSQADQIESLWNDIKDNQSALNATTKNKYQKILQFIVDLQSSNKEVINLLGKEKEQYYLIVLQNTAEQRPNGGFFGSFAVVSLYQGKIKTFHLIDSYLPQKYNTNISVALPKRSYPIYPDQNTARIAANKFGFHDLDGNILINLYNSTFNALQSNKLPKALCKDLCNKQLAGVVFLRTDMMNIILPDFKKKQREWQFLNANIDLIRGANLPNKKERYFSDLKAILEQQQGQLVARFLSQFEKLSNENYLGIYIPQASSELKHILSTYQLTTLSPSFSTTPSLYLWDTNTSFNKVDDFVSKHSIIKNQVGDIVTESNNSIIPIDTLGSGNYSLEITYTINVPESYKKYISGLEAQYGIQMTDRERGILAIEATDNYPDLIKRLRSTRSQIYFPKNWIMGDTSGDAFGIIKFSPPFGQGLQYKLETASNQDTKKLIIKFKIT